jgi:D-alanyl-D-alanine carboxypeptidase
MIAAVASLAISTSQADARRSGHGKAAHSRSKVVHARAKRSIERYSPPYSDIVVDANSGEVLHEKSADSLRHPASLTKIMTLYLLFEQLEAGRVTLNTPLQVSAHAAAQAPSKLGLRPGQEIRVEDAIRAVVTKSANDVAVVIAENLAEDEPAFARMMTRKAQALGMGHTLYRNASGLPNDEQITTARDLALLGRAIQDRFPKYYRYFSTPSFIYHGHVMRNHNHLLGRVEGVDGIKTGYVSASGFNLVTSVRRGGRHIVAVVLGGRTAGARDARMRELINENVMLASLKRTAPSVVEVAENAAPLPRERVAPPVRVAAASPVRALPAPENIGEIATSRTDDASSAVPNPEEELKPIPVKTVKVKASTLQMAPIGSIVPLPARAAEPAPRKAPVTTASISAVVESRPPAPLPVRNSEPETAAATPVGAQVASIKADDPGATATGRARDRIAAVSTSAFPASVHSGWMIQVGALESIEAANHRLSLARSKAMNILAGASAFTEPVVKGDKTLHRARFAVIDKSRAEAACRALKRADIVCMPIKN